MLTGLAVGSMSAYQSYRRQMQRAEQAVADIRNAIAAGIRSNLDDSVQALRTITLNPSLRTSFSDGDRVRATFEILTATGWAPHESQSRPARRGSANVSLERFLNRDTPG